jgi:hypothetical protein
VQDWSGSLFGPPVGRPPDHVRGFCATFRGLVANPVRLRRHAPLCDPGQFLRRLSTRVIIADRSMMARRAKLIWIGAEVVGQARHVAFDIVEGDHPGRNFADILRLIGGVRATPAPSTASAVPMAPV